MRDERGEPLPSLPRGVRSFRMSEACPRTLQRRRRCGSCCRILRICSRLASAPGLSPRRARHVRHAACDPRSRLLLWRSRATSVLAAAVIALLFGGALGRGAHRCGPRRARPRQHRDRRDRRLPARAVLHRALARARSRSRSCCSACSTSSSRRRSAPIDARMKSGIGVMVDDLVAAGFALVVYAAVVAARPDGRRSHAKPGGRRPGAAHRGGRPQPLHTRRQLFYDGWLLFLLAGKAKRGRSVNAHFGSTLPLAEKIAHCERLYARHGLPALFRITPFAQPAHLDAALAAARLRAIRSRRSCRWRRSQSPPTRAAATTMSMSTCR